MALTNGDRVTAEHAKNLLEKRFTGQDEKKTKSDKLTVLLVDELDMLWNRWAIVINIILRLKYTGLLHI